MPPRQAVHGNLKVLDFLLNIHKTYQLSVWVPPLLHVAEQSSGLTPPPTGQAHYYAPLRPQNFEQSLHHWHGIHT